MFSPHSFSHEYNHKKRHKTLLFYWSFVDDASINIYHVDTRDDPWPLWKVPYHTLSIILPFLQFFTGHREPCSDFK